MLIWCAWNIIIIYIYIVVILARPWVISVPDTNYWYMYTLLNKPEYLNMQGKYVEVHGSKKQTSASYVQSTVYMFNTKGRC